NPVQVVLRPEPHRRIGIGRRNRQLIGRHGWGPGTPTIPRLPIGSIAAFDSRWTGRPVSLEYVRPFAIWSAGRGQHGREVYLPGPPARVARIFPDRLPRGGIKDGLAGIIEQGAANIPRRPDIHLAVQIDDQGSEERFVSSAVGSGHHRETEVHPDAVGLPELA